jgi:uncharacterized membrane protein
MLVWGDGKAAQMIVRHFYGRPGLGYRGPGPFAVLLLIVLMALLVVAVIRLVHMRRYGNFVARTGGHRWHQAPWGGAPGVAQMYPGIDPALHELRLRYARGELTREEFLERSHDLGAPGGTAGPSSA